VAKGDQHFLIIGFLPGDPLGMSTNIPIFLEFLKVREFSSQGHFVIVVMDAVVAKAANKDSLIEVFPGIPLLKPGPPMQFFRDEMVKGQCDSSTAQRTIASFINHCQSFEE
jgi:hypothetical protein